MIKILHIVSTISQSSGVMNFIMNYYRNLDNKKLVFDFLYFRDVDNNFKEEIEQLGGNVIKIGMPKLTITFIKQVNNFFKKNGKKYTAIHCHPIFSFIIFSMFARKFGIKNIIQHSHTLKFSNKKLSAIRNRLIMLFSSSQITHYVACSLEATKVFNKKDIRKKGCLILNNAIDVEKYEFNKYILKKTRNNLGILPTTKVIGHIGRFSSEKNHDILLDIFFMYNKIIDDTKLLLIGEGLLEEQIRQKVLKLNLKEKVIFCGFRNDIPELLSAMDYFILPSDFEGFGIVALEAQASGLLTICSQGVPDCAIISNETFKFNVYDKNELELIVKKLIKYNSYKRKNNSELISKAGYNIKIEAKKMEKFYLGLEGSEK